MPTLLGISLPAWGEAQYKSHLSSLLCTQRGVRVFTPNAVMLYTASQDPKLHRLLRGAHVLLPDGSGMVLASRLVGEPLPCRLTGIDMAEWLLAFAERQGLRVFFLGGKPGVAEEAARRMRQRHPGLCVAGTLHGYCSDASAAAGAIAKAAPDLLFVCMGFPTQEQWITDHISELPSVRMALGLGGTLDVWAGRVCRAPRHWQCMGLEWLWRTAREPRRLGTALMLPRFLWQVLRHRKR